MPNYAWIIDKDFSPDEKALPASNLNATGLTGPSGVCAKILQQFEKGLGSKFRMKDHDGEVHYEGRIIAEYAEFQPLDDFGTPNAGCTYIEYIDSAGEWVRL